MTGFDFFGGFLSFLFFGNLFAWSGISPIGSGISPIGSGISPIGSGVSPIG
jgi:hypothetical protein